MIYIISTIKLSKKNKYKIGRHKGTLEKLCARYQTALINPVVYYSIETQYAVYIESKIKRKLYDYRITNDKGNKSEWVILDLASIVSKIHIIITHHNRKLSHLIELSNKKHLTDTESRYIRTKMNKYTTTKSKDVKTIGERKKMSPEEMQIRNEKMKLIREEKLNVKEQVITADVSGYNLKTLIRKQATNTLTKTEEYVLKKLSLIETFGVINTEKKKSTVKFLREFYDCELKFKRFVDFFGYEQINDDFDDNKIPMIDNPPPIHGIDNNDFDNLTATKKKLRKKIVVDILNRFLGLNKQEYVADDLNNITITGAQYKKAILDISENSLYFIDESKNRSLFFKNKGKFQGINNKSHYAKTVQTLLDLFSIKLHRIKRVCKKGKFSYPYSLSVDEQIKKIADFKYRKVNEIDIFTEIFEKQ